MKPRIAILAIALPAATFAAGEATALPVAGAAMRQPATWMMNSQRRGVGVLECRQGGSYLAETSILDLYRLTMPAYLDV